ncbi:MAG TPA: Xaa-Pro peptidase family protein [Candidatus Koribacter sp.]
MPPRLAELALSLTTQKLDALLITHLPNIRYLVGFTGSNGLLLVQGSRATFFTDGRYTEQAREEVAGAKVIIPKGSLVAAACKLIKSGELGIEADRLTVLQHESLLKLLPKGVKLVPTAQIVDRIRMVKDSGELSLIKEAVILGAEILTPALETIRPGVKESEVAAEIEYAARRWGAEAMSFETIVAAGLRSALPHGRASNALIPKRGFVVLDLGVILHGYCSDMTRTVHVGPLSRRARTLYQAVLEAQEAAIEAVKPGATAGDVDHAARSVLKKAKLDRYFIHSTGHGVGLEIHESPRVARGQTEVLKPGMVITIEPGVYLPDEGGVRIEDMVAVTESGHEILTPATKQLLEL